MSESKPDAVPGLGFKDKEKALETIKNLEGRDPDYQKLAIKGLIGRAKRTLTLTKDKEKLQNINEAMGIFDKWLADFESKGLSKQNRAYLPLSTVTALMPYKKKYNLDDAKADAFLKAYKTANGEYKTLRTVSSGENGKTWDIVRNTALDAILEDIDSSDLWAGDSVPSEDHVRLIMWAYSPEASKIKKNLTKITDQLDEDEEDENDDEEDEVEEEEEKEKKSSKRKSNDSSEDSHTKKNKSN